MTRANINYIYQNIGEAPRTLFYYRNGDQYPEGLRDHFNVLRLLSEPITPDRFRDWIRKNYSEGKEKATVDDLGEGGQPKIYYTDGFITDYSYVFCPDGRDNFLAYQFQDKIFQGTREEMADWFRKYNREKNEHMDNRIDSLIDCIYLNEPQEFYKTAWGKKTREGLRETVKTILFNQS